MVVNKILQEFSKDEFSCAYCSLNKNEYIILVNEEGYIFDTLYKNEIGKIFISIYEQYVEIKDIINKYKDAIATIEDDEMETNQTDVVIQLFKLSEELKKVCIYFNNTDIVSFFVEEYINLFKEFNRKKEDISNDWETYECLKKKQGEEANQKLKEIIEGKENKIAQYSELTFKKFVIQSLENFILNISSTMLSCNIYFDKKSDKYVPNKNSFTALNYNQIFPNSYTCHIKGVFEKDNQLISDVSSLKEPNEKFKFVKVYQFKSIVELLNLALLNIIENKVKINICENCNKIFIPQKRSDEKYCDRVSPQKSNKTCKEYGAKKVYREKMKNDKILIAHNNTRQFLRMRRNRAKKANERVKYQKKLNKYNEKYQIRKEAYMKKKLSAEEFLSWIENQKLID